MSDFSERKANTVATDGERDRDMSNDAENSANHSTASRKRAASGPAPTCAPTLQNLDEATDGELRVYLEEEAFQALAQDSVIKKPRVEVIGGREAPFEINLAALSFPRKLWHIVENDTYKSIGWDPQGINVVIDYELFVHEILNKREDSKIFITTNMKNFVRQLNLYGFNKVGLSRHRSSLKNSRGATGCVSKKQVFHNRSFCRGHPELLDHVKRRVGIKSELVSGPVDHPMACASQSLLPQQTSNGEASLDPSDLPLDLSLKKKLPRTSTSTSSTFENSMNAILLRSLSILIEMTCLVQGSTTKKLSPDQLQPALASWISLSTPWLLASGLAPTGYLPPSAVNQPCPSCGQNRATTESPQT